MVKITVTQDDIDHGKRASCTECPIALAVKRLPIGQGVSVSSYALLFEDGRYACLPQTATDFIETFDRWGAKRVMPIEFEVNVWMLRPPFTGATNG